MPLPVIAGAAAAVAARLAAKKAAQKLAQEAAKKVVKTTAAKVVSKDVKVLPRKTAPKTDLSNRGVRPTKSQRSERAGDLYMNKAEGRWQGEYLTRMTGLKGPKNIETGRTRGQGARSLRKEAAIKKEAKPVVKINSAPKKTADSARAANAKALKAANKPVSKGNRNIGGPVVRNIIKNSPPARANRTRLGNPAKKK